MFQSSYKYTEHGYFYAQSTYLFSELTVFGGGVLAWSILGIFRGTGATSVLECLEARLLDVDGVGSKRFRTNLGVFESTNAGISDIELEKRKY